ncbi:MAG: hypothetical protein LBK28_02050 [Propionibacteriaceae bacterium]|jgi:hypothetical protein|nr:hypothetical protein [Propionibacteriaceae bacterium]
MNWFGAGGKRHISSGGLSLMAPDPLAELAGTVIPEAESAAAVARPDQIGRTWVEHQADELVREQGQLYDAEGLAASRGPETSAAGLKTAAQAALQQVANQAAQTETARLHAETVRTALAGFVSRAPGAKGWYVGRMVALYGGDVAAVTGACVMLGEIPTLAAMLAASSGAAAVIGGMAGGELKRLRLARERQTDPGHLPEHLTPWRHLFSGGKAGHSAVKTMALVTAAILASLGIGVVTLRWALDGFLAGAAFGAFSLAIGLASAWNSYDYADDVADSLDAADKAHYQAGRQHTRAAGVPAIRRYQTAVSTAASIQAEYAARGQAAGHRIRATLFAVLGRHPQIVGHGTKPESSRSTAAKPRRPVRSGARP